jgi:hypothetical protein
MLWKPRFRWIVSGLVTAFLMIGDYFLQTRLPAENPADTTRQSWVYRMLTWTVPPEGQRDTAFFVYTALDFAVTVVIVYFFLTRWQRRREQATIKT